MRSLVMALVGIISAFLLGQSLGHKEGIVEGKSQALKTNPPSDELEMVCAGLWVGEQNKKAWEKDRARKH